MNTKNISYNEFAKGLTGCTPFQAKTNFRRFMRQLLIDAALAERIPGTSEDELLLSYPRDSYPDDSPANDYFEYRVLVLIEFFKKEGFTPAKIEGFKPAYEKWRKERTSRVRADAARLKAEKEKARKDESEKLRKEKILDSKKTELVYIGDAATLDSIANPTPKTGPHKTR